MQVGPHGVTAKFRAGDHVQDGHDRRLVFKGDIGMPLISHATTGGCQFEYLIMLSEGVLQVGMVFNLAERLPSATWLSMSIC